MPNLGPGGILRSLHGPQDLPGPVRFVLRLYLFYALSGLISLGYQVMWFRIYVDKFGSTNLTFVVVLCNFIGGLGVGALASRRVTELAERYLRLSNRHRI